MEMPEEKYHLLIHFLKLVDSNICIEGETDLPASLGEDAIAVYAEFMGRWFSTENLSKCDDVIVKGRRIRYRRYFRFMAKIPEQPEFRICFFFYLDGGKRYYDALFCQRFCPISIEVPNQYAVLGQGENKLLALMPGNYYFYFKQVTKQAVQVCEANYRYALQWVNSEASLNALSFREALDVSQKENRIWLFADRINEGGDNGEALFEYIHTNVRAIASFFIISCQSKRGKELQEKYGEAIVDALSEQHRKLHCMAEYIFTSQPNGFIENPFGTAEKYYRDLIHRPQVVFLQHGVTKDNQSGHFNRFYQDFHAVITSGERETAELCREPYFYKTEQIWQTGMPRYEKLVDKREKVIVIAPTWRSDLMKQEFDPTYQAYFWRDKGKLRKSQYVRVYGKLLNNKTFLAMTSAFGYQIIFAPHPQMRPYNTYFNAPSSVKMLGMESDISYAELVERASLIITDYSSVAFDFAYMKKPVLYYQFDEEEFFANHTYQKGYFDYRADGFGPVVTRQRELIYCIQSLLSTDCMMSEKYQRRVNQFFGFLYGKSCQSIVKKALQTSKIKEG